MLFISFYLFFISSMSLVIVLTVLNASCIFSILFSSLWSIFTIIILNSLSGRLLISSSFIWSYEFLPYAFICTVFLCLFIFLSFFLFLTCSTWGLLFPGFRAVLVLPFDFFPWREMLVGWIVWISGWGDLCLCSSGRGSSR